MKEILNENLLELYEPIIRNYVYEELPINIFVSNKDGYIVWGNSRVIDTLKETKETFIGKHLSAWGEENWDHCKKVIETGREHTEEEIGMDNHIYLTTRKPFSFKNGCIAGVIGLSSDITETKQAEILTNEILINMRHDLRTPLEGIMGCAQLLQLGNNPKKQQEHVRSIIASSKALLEFHNKVLEAIQVTTGGIPLIKKKFDLKRQMELVIDLNTALANTKKLALTLNYDEATPLYLIGDPVRIQRIVLELITNALTFTDHGKVTLTVQLFRDTDPESIIKIAVSDTGIGMPLGEQQAIFTRFKRLTPSYQNIYKGAGLGLSIIKQFIDDLGGEIQLDSQPGQGSTFTCFIPFKNPLTMDSAGVVELVPIQRQQRGLIVDGSF
ncbi:sensor histidine kinase [Rickettsiella endosymbiont of Dermanyssus gallinae]|uniref:sensor histidine kinase n=1 Tax=Rickettsiella endosymbiont of Dermanyssus gallinae TaxID=2856608 RepID=UPI001C52CF1F|nr:PAS domain-containing sensor histidine kinase [Rickettsiella endosymbiont of Dermanyssus gallinae]